MITSVERSSNRGEFADRKNIRNSEITAKFGPSIRYGREADGLDMQIAPAEVIRSETESKNPRVINLGIIKRPELPTKAPSVDQALIRQEVMQSQAIVSAPVEAATPKPEIKSPRADVLKNFTANQEADSLRQKYNDGLAEGKSPDEVVDRIVTENLANIRAYQWEYTMSDPILVNPVKLNEDGELVNSKSEYSILRMTSKEERDGAVFDSVVKTQSLLKDADPGDLVMIVSPAGWSGRVDSQGKEIIYPEAEIFAFIKGEDRNVRALTFVADLDMGQCDEFRSAFVIPDPEASQKKLTEKERIIEMTSSPIHVKGGKTGFVEILDRIQAIKGGLIMREADGAHRTFREAREFLARGDELQQMPDLCEEVIETYEQYLRKNITKINNSVVHGAIKQRMEMTIFELAKILTGDKNEQKQISNFYMQAMNAKNLQIIDARVVDENYDAIIQFLQTRPGCNGGGLTETSFMFGQSLGDILSGVSGVSTLRGISGLNGEVTRCRQCNEEICEGKCYKCKISYKKTA